MKENSPIGRRAPRQDGRAKALGEYVYGMDFGLPNALEAVVVRSPVPHGRITDIDTHGAEALPGVRAVIFGRNVSPVHLNGTVEDQFPLARDVVRYFGEPVGLVAAETLDQAREAAAVIEVRISPLPVLNDPDAAMRPGAVLLHPDWKTYATDQEMGIVRDGNVCCHATLKVGDIDRGFSEADIVVEGDYETASVHQAHVEPRVATGVVEDDGTVAVYTNTQLPYWVRTQVSLTLGLPEERVRIVPLGIGGGFGSKLYALIEPFVALLALRARRPVHLAIPIEEELISGVPRHPTRTHLRTGVKKDGTIVAHEARMVVDAGAYAGSAPEVAGIGALMLTGPYRLPNVRYDGLAVYTNKTNFGAYRGPGGPQSVFALESHIDVIAERLGIDPLELRLHNIAGEGEEQANGQVLTAVGLRDAVTRAAKAIDWGTPCGPNRGKGIALSWWTTTLQKSTVQLSVDTAGRIVVSVGTQEIGTGALMGAVPQMVAAEMGVEPEDVVVQVTDTGQGLWDWGSQGSRTAFNIGQAAQKAGRQLLPRIKEAAAAVLGVDPEELSLSNRAISVHRRPSDRVSLGALAAADDAGNLSVRLESVPEPQKFKKERLSSIWYPAFHHPHFFCHTAEVEIDRETGHVKVLRYVAAHDVGYAINPTLVEGQLQGGAVQGIGMALTEELRWVDGVPRTRNWTDYKLPTIRDVPDIIAIPVESYKDDRGAVDMKGLGEAPAIPPPAAIANAVARAAGIRMCSLPMTPERILGALRSEDRAGKERL